jgi:hypothetical protein
MRPCECERPTRVGRLAMLPDAASDSCRAVAADST